LISFHDSVSISTKITVGIPIDQLSTTTREHIRAHSKALFGNRDTLEVGFVVASSPDGVVHATGIADDLRMAPNRARAQLERFLELELMTDGKTLSHDRRRWFVRTESPVWRLFLALYEEWSR
jgi:hypothetical protein